MSFVKIDNDVIDSLTIELHPSYKYTSSSAGSTGAINVKARGDRVLKDIYEPTPLESEEHHFEHRLGEIEGIEAQLDEIAEETRNGGETNVFETMAFYMEGSTFDGGDYIDNAYAINKRGPSYKNDVQIEIARFDPPFEYSYESAIKYIIKDNIMKEHVTDTDNSEFSFTNYNSINFFTASGVPSDSVIMYPTPPGSGGTTRGRYVPEGAFSMDFYINPRYQNDSDSVAFEAGTIMHLSSTFALSLVSGSQKDENGKANAFRIMLQMGHSADIEPSTIDTTILNHAALGRSESDKKDLIFVSEDNALKLNNWHHVTVRWGTQTVNFGTGSIRIDDTSETYFCVHSSSITPTTTALSAAAKGDIDVLFIGNYYKGTNRISDGSETERFFYGSRNDVGLAGGLIYDDGLAWENDNYGEAAPTYTTVTTDMENGTKAKFEHPLNAEIQELKLYSKYLNTNEVNEFAVSNPSDFELSGSLMFYLPPSFVPESPTRSLRTSTAESVDDMTTINPFNSRYSFRSNVREINLENYFRDFRQGIYPRFFNLSIALTETPTSTYDNSTSDYWYYTKDNLRKRNLTILPSDNGLFTPTFSHLMSGSGELTIVSRSLGTRDYPHPLHKFKNQLKVTDLSKINISSLFEGWEDKPPLFNHVVYLDFKGEESEAAGTDADEGLTTDTTVRDTIDYDDINLDISDGVFNIEWSTFSEVHSLYPMYQEYRDDSSNEITIFDITNLSYGNSIQRNTFKLYDSSLRGSGGKASMMLKDNGRGSLYRADCLTKQATWNNIGNIFYSEGIAIIKAPTIPFFGKDQFEVSFKGIQNLHVMTIDAKAKIDHINKSTNSSYDHTNPVSSSLDVNVLDDSFVYISGINYHDENLNVIMRTNLTQPVKKKEEDSFVFRTKFDW